MEGLSILGVIYVGSTGTSEEIALTEHRLIANNIQSLWICQLGKRLSSLGQVGVKKIGPQVECTT